MLPTSVRQYRTPWRVESVLTSHTIPYPAALICPSPISAGLTAINMSTCDTIGPNYCDISYYDIQQFVGEEEPASGCDEIVITINQYALPLRDIWCIDIYCSDIYCSNMIPIAIRHCTAGHHQSLGEIPDVADGNEPDPGFRSVTISTVIGGLQGRLIFCQLQYPPRERNHTQIWYSERWLESCEILMLKQQMVIIHYRLAKYMFKSLQTSSVLCPATIHLNNYYHTPWHGLKEYLHHHYRLTIPHFLQHFAIVVSRFHTLRSMSEHLFKALVEAYLEVSP
jgi:hypothetical protein